MRKQRENFACTGIMGAAPLIARDEIARAEDISRSPSAMGVMAISTTVLDQLDKFPESARSSLGACAAHEPIPNSTNESRQDFTIATGTGQDGYAVSAIRRIATKKSQSSPRGYGCARNR